ncbi:hypothetical protein M758_2G211900, partial [Ceratodon purpureus]
QWVTERLFEKAYPLLGPLDADSVAKQRSNVPNLRSSKRVQTRSPRLQPVFLAKPYRPHHFTAYFTRVCALRCACEDSLQRHCRPDFPHTYDIALLRLLSVARVRYGATSFDTSRSLSHQITLSLLCCRP